MTPNPLLTIELLADRNLKPAALLIAFDSMSAVLASPALEEEFRALATRTPCLMLRGAAHTAVSAALQAAGCAAVEPAAILRTDRLGGEAPAAAVQWIAGPWYMAPPARPVGTQGASRALALQLVQLVAADADTREIEAVLRRDPALSYHLLRLVNSLGMGMRRQITSFAQAILILGRAQLRRWLNLMLFSARAGDDRSAMLLARVAVRARLMELLAREGGLDKSGQESAFMAGMFSLLGCLFGMPLEEVLRPLKVSESLLAAVLRHEGDVGRLLLLAETAERADTAALAPPLAAMNLSHDEFNLLTVQAHLWMLDVAQETAGVAGAAGA